MKQPVDSGIIEFPSERTMANSNILAAFAILLISLSLSSAFIQQDLGISQDFETYFDNEQQFLREKRQNNLQDLFEEKQDFVKLEENLSEAQTIHEKRTVGEEKISQIDDKKDEAQEKLSTPKTSNDIKENVQDDTFSYRNMHDFIQAMILVDESGIIERLQKMQELENATESEKLSNLPKRHASASASASATATAVTSDLLGGNLWDAVPLTDLDSHSCEVESIEYGHVHLSGIVVHELFCELRKFWHYILIILRNLKEGLTLGPLVAGEAIVSGSHGILSRLLHYIPHVFRHIIKEPHHLLLLPDIFCDAVPFPSITGAIHRVKHVFFKLLHFVRELIHGHIRCVLRHIFHHLGTGLREKLHGLCLGKLHHLGLHSAFPLEESVTSVTSATATATATATTSDNVIPDYHRSLAEVLTSLRGFYNGYHASGIPQLIRTGVGSISTSSAVSTVRSYVSRLPFSNYFGCGQNAAVTSTATSAVSTSSASAASVATPVIAPIMSPTIVPITPIVESEIASASASATASVVTETQPLIAPVVSVAPTVYPCEPTSIVPSDVSAATATATATATAAASSPVEIPLIEPVPIFSPAIDTVESAVSASSSASAATLTAPEIIALSANNPGSTVTSTAAASAAASNVVSSPLPFSLPQFRYRPRPILSPVLSPAAASASAVSSASSSSTGGPTLFIPNQYGLNFNRYRRPLFRQPIHSSVPSAAAASAAASAATSLGGTSASTASAVSSLADNLNFVLPRQDIIGALGSDYLLPGDVIAITLKNRSVLCGHVFDGSSPIRFSFLKPKLRASVIRNGRRIWNLLPRHFRNPQCVRRLNNPLLLRYGQHWL
ncbi:uncharacterized protein [Linepithema humile]|uniref:uncharacterized protein n=1 Tax=Linepithema humile TaxID=83485 RepID=UPI0006239BD2|nr:PREDICTED: uncharacterized protein LOC105668189 [Linepithema humile]